MIKASKQLLPAKDKPSTLETITRLKRGDWLIIPLGILAISGGYFVYMNLSGIFSPMVLVALFVTLFSIIYIIKTFLRLPRNIISKIAAYTFSIFIVAVGIFMILNSQSSCGSTSMLTSCSDANYFLFILLFLNPFTMPFLALVSIVGIVASLFPSRK